MRLSNKILIGIIAGTVLVTTGIVLVVVSISRSRSTNEPTCDQVRGMTVLPADLTACTSNGRIFGIGHWDCGDGRKLVGDAGPYGSLWGFLGGEAHHPVGDVEDDPGYGDTFYHDCPSPSLDLNGVP